MSVLVAGIHTGIGKTLCSAILCESLGYDYWKPVQAGDLENSDSIFIRSHVSNPTCKIHPEAFALKTPLSPHRAAALEGVEITAAAFSLPKSSNKIVVETAGGIMSPLNTRFTNVDLARHLNLPVVVVSHDYLGSINHTLLTIEALQKHDINILGLVFSGREEPSSRSFILSYTQLPLLFSIPYMEAVNPRAITQLSHRLTIPPL